VKKWAIIFVLLFPAVAFANPARFGPFGSIKMFIVLGSAFGAEVSLITVILFFCHIEPVPAFFTVLAGNLAIYFALFLPILSSFDNLLIAEVVIVATDGAFIKAISQFDTFQMEDFKGLKWPTALIIAAAGNALSYYIGTVIGV
jgi:hypothetical protein